MDKIVFADVKMLQLLGDEVRQTSY